MPILELLALSVAKLEAELAASTYTADELQQAIDAEAAGENRSTAIKALQEALDGLKESEEAAGEKLFVCDGKAITTKAGIKAGGDEITEGMLSAESIEKLLEKEYLEIKA